LRRIDKNAGGNQSGPNSFLGFVLDDGGGDGLSIEGDEQLGADR